MHVFMSLADLKTKELMFIKQQDIKNVHVLHNNYNTDKRCLNPSK